MSNRSQALLDPIQGFSESEDDLRMETPWVPQCAKRTLFGVMAGAFLLGEPITFFLICALVLVGTGIYPANRK
jgi:hypothetical protein